VCVCREGEKPRAACLHHHPDFGPRRAELRAQALAVLLEEARLPLCQCAAEHRTRTAVMMTHTHTHAHAYPAPAALFNARNLILSICLRRWSTHAALVAELSADMWYVCIGCVAQP
jgi:hypothetical protein